jgi:hypothetical protein
MGVFMMKKILLITSFLTTGAIVQAENSRTEVLNNSVVKSTYSLMQSKNNNECDELNEKSLTLLYEAESCFSYFKTFVENKKNRVIKIQINRMSNIVHQALNKVLKN